MKAVMLLLLLAVSACQLPTEPAALQRATDPSLLIGDQWHLVQFSDSTGTVAGATARLTVRFTADSRISGANGPNRHEGFYSATQRGEINVRDVSSTWMGGPEAIQAAVYLEGLVRSHSYDVTAAELRLKFGEKGFLHFERAP